MHCTRCIEISHFVNVAKHTHASVLFLEQFCLTMGFYWSYTLLLKLPVLMRSCMELICHSLYTTNQ